MRCLAHFEVGFPFIYIYIFIPRIIFYLFFYLKEKRRNLLFLISKYFHNMFCASRNPACCLVQFSSGERDSGAKGEVYYDLFGVLFWWFTTINISEKIFIYLLYLLNYHDSRDSRKENSYIGYNMKNKSFCGDIILSSANFIKNITSRVVWKKLFWAK